MTRRAIVMTAALTLVACSSPAFAQDPPADMTMSVVPQSAEWQKLTSLVGHWEGVMEHGGQKLPSKAELRMTGDGSAIMHVMDRDTPHEMVTMIHPDGKRLIATHYCAAHNQPRMALVPSQAANQVAFEFIDGTNIAPGDSHMRRLVIHFVDADHHEAHWTSRAKSGDITAVFKYTRKPAAK